MLIHTKPRNRIKIKNYLDDNKINWARSYRNGIDNWSIFFRNDAEKDTVLATVEKLNENIVTFKDFLSNNT